MLNINTNNLHIISNVVFFCCCFVHISLNGYYILFPPLPEIKRTNVNLKDIEFPLPLKVCVSEISSKSYHRYSNHGYKNVFSFFNGMSAYNESLFGWAGHTKDGQKIGEISSCFVVIKYQHNYFNVN